MLERIIDLADGELWQQQAQGRSCSGRGWRAWFSVGVEPSLVLVATARSDPEQADIPLRRPQPDDRLVPYRTLEHNPWVRQAIGEAARHW
jgi:hypothetical protein